MKIFRQRPRNLTMKNTCNVQLMCYVMCVCVHVCVSFILICRINYIEKEMSKRKANPDGPVKDPSRYEHLYGRK